MSPRDDLSGLYKHTHQGKEVVSRDDPYVLFVPAHFHFLLKAAAGLVRTHSITTGSTLTAQNISGAFPAVKLLGFNSTLLAVFL